MRQHSVLIVEDDPIFALDLAEAVWESGGRPVGPARCLQGALELASQQTIDLAIIDIQLADGRTGLALARLLAEEHGIRTVVVSGDVPDPAAMRSTAHTFVQKPVPTSVLTDLMGAARAPRRTAPVGV